MLKSIVLLAFFLASAFAACATVSDLETGEANALSGAPALADSVTVTGATTCASIGSCAVISGNCRMVTFTADVQWLSTAVVSVSFPELTSSRTLDFTNNAALTTINLPKLATISAGLDGLIVDDNDVLVTLNTPLLSSVSAIDNALVVVDNALLASASFPALVSSTGTSGSAFTFSGNAALSSLTAPVLASLSGGLNAINVGSNAGLASLSLTQLASATNNAITGTTFGATINLNVASVNLNGLTTATNTAGGAVLAGSVATLQVCALETVSPIAGVTITGATARNNNAAVTTALTTAGYTVTACCSVVEHLYFTERYALLAAGILDSETNGPNIVFATQGDGRCRCTSFNVDVVWFSTSLATISFPVLVDAEGLIFVTNPSLTTVSFGALSTAGSASATDAIYFDSNTALTSVNFNSVVTASAIDSAIYFVGNTALTSLSFNALTSSASTTGTALTIASNSALTTLSFPLLTNLASSGLNALNINDNDILGSVVFPVLNSASNNQVIGALFGATINLDANPLATNFQFHALTSVTNLGGGRTFGGNVASLEACLLGTATGAAPSIVGTGNLLITNAVIRSTFTAWTGLSTSCEGGLEISFSPSSTTEAFVCISGRQSASEGRVLPADDGLSTMVFSSGMFSLTASAAPITVTQGTLTLGFTSCTTTGGLGIQCTLSTPTDMTTVYTGCATFNLPAGWEFVTGYQTGLISFSAKKRQSSSGNWILAFGTTE